jgi:hypothetical protein
MTQHFEGLFLNPPSLRPEEFVLKMYEKSTKDLEDI